MAHEKKMAALHKKKLYLQQQNVTPTPSSTWQPNFSFTQPASLLGYTETDEQRYDTPGHRGGSYQER